MSPRRRRHATQKLLTALVASFCLLAIAPLLFSATPLDAQEGNPDGASPPAGDPAGVEVRAEELIDEDLTDDKAGPIVEGRRTRVKLFSESAKRSARRKGRWSKSADWPLFAIHAAVLPNGKVVTYGTDSSGQRSNGLQYDIWDPAKGMTPKAHTTLAVRTNTNIFCSAQNLVDGKLLITGGDESPVGLAGSGIREANLLDPANNSLSATGTMARDRWYPTVVNLPDGRALVHGGRVDKSTPATLPEVYDPATGRFSSLNQADSSTVYAEDTRGWYYPRSFVNNSGNVTFYTVNSSDIFELDVDANGGNGSLRRAGSGTRNPFRLYYPSANFAPGKVLTFTDGGKSVVVDINTFETREVADIGKQRVWSDATVLADGKVAVTGGAEQRQQLDTAVLNVQIYDPETDTWSGGARARHARLYHSATVLLPNGALLAAGGGPPGPVLQLNAEVYYPAYLFDSEGDWATRPIIGSAPRALRYGQDATVSFQHSRPISRVTMVGLGSATHSLDMGQSFRELSFSRSGTSQLNLDTSVLGRNDTPPGNYMIFLIDSEGVPSEAALLQLG